MTPACSPSLCVALSTATQVFAEVDDLTRRAWPYLAEGVRFDVIRNRLEAELPDVDVDQQLRQLIGTLLTHRFLYFNDFHPNKRVIAQPLQADASPSKP